MLFLWFLPHYKWNKCPEYGKLAKHAMEKNHFQSRCPNLEWKTTRIKAMRQNEKETRKIYNSLVYTTWTPFQMRTVMNMYSMVNVLSSKKNNKDAKCMKQWYSRLTQEYLLICSPKDI